MCREREIDQSQVDNTATDQYNQLLEQLRKSRRRIVQNQLDLIEIDNELNELLATTAHLQEESDRLEQEARKLIDENIQVQIEARLLKEKYRHQRRRRRRHRQSFSLVKKRLSFQQLKRQLFRQRQSFVRFERRLRAKYEQPFRQIVSTSAQHRCRRIRSIPSESID